MKIGLTGGIGCGKSTAVDIFARHGLQTIQSDALVRSFLEEDASIRSAVFERWGERVTDADGAINRKKIASIVFRESSELEWLEQLLHPRVREAWESAIRAAGDADILVEIPLLFEKSLETAFDFTVCVASPSELVMERMQKRGYSESDVQQRQSIQMPLTEKIKRADYVISNAGSIEFLEEQILRLIKATCRSAK